MCDRIYLKIAFVCALFLSLLSFTPASSLDLKIKSGADCQLLYLPPNNIEVDRVWVWDQKSSAFIQYRCIRSDTKVIGVSCSDEKIKAKFLKNNNGPSCSWMISVDEKTKKPRKYQSGGRVNESCLDKKGNLFDQYQYFVENNKLVALKCNAQLGVWVAVAGEIISQPPKKESSSQSSTNATPTVNLEKACLAYASAIVDFDRRVSNFNSAVLLREAQRNLQRAEIDMFTATSFDPKLSPLKTAYQIMSKHAYDKFSASKISTVDPNVLRMAVGTFNSYCGTGIYIAP